MLYEAAKAVALDEAAYFTMGIVPLVSPAYSALPSEPTWLAFLRQWAKAHYTRFYNFRGLSEFKSKFHPIRWQPVVVIVKDARFRIWQLRSVGWAFTRTLPEVALTSAILKAFAKEIGTLGSFITSRFKVESQDGGTDDSRS
jgi:lysylphosphatidylglycerol synthetase-like protein (DUF2156 family)